jgi:hypothetical protein
MRYSLPLEAMYTQLTKASKKSSSSSSSSSSGAEAAAEKVLLEKTIFEYRRMAERLNLAKGESELKGVFLEKEKFYGVILTGPARRYLSDTKFKLVTHNSKLSQNAILCSEILFLGKRKKLFSASTLVEYDLHQIQVIRYAPGQSRYFIIRLTQQDGMFGSHSSFLLSSPPLHSLQCFKLSSLLSFSVMNGFRNSQLLSLRSSFLLHSPPLVLTSLYLSVAGHKSPM